MPLKKTKGAGEFEEVLAGKWLPKNWEIFSPTISPLQMMVKLGHLNPLDRANKEYLFPKIISSVDDGKEMTVAVGVNLPKEAIHGSNKDLFEMLNVSMQMGYLKKWGDQKKLDDLRKQFNEMNPEKYDVSFPLTVIKAEDEEAAKVMLNNTMTGFTEGPLGMEIPGMPPGTKISSILDNPLLKQYLNKEQMEQMEKFKKMAPEIEKQIKNNAANSKVKMNKGKFLGCDAVYFEGKDGKMYQSIRAGEFIIQGISSLTAAFPSGSIACDSLTKFSTKHITDHTGGLISHREEITPEKSTLAREGFLNKEEVSDILEKLIKILYTK